MFTKRSILRISVLFIAALLMSGTASAKPLTSPLAEALGTAFTYQGHLIDGGSPANGSYDFQFALFNALTGGTQAGYTLTKPGVTVTNGLFTVQLDFGNVFDGTALYLEIGVRPGGSSGDNTQLAPRQSLGATPYALHATQASNAYQLDGQLASAFAQAVHTHFGDSWSGPGIGLTLSGGSVGLSGSGSLYGLFGNSDTMGVSGSGPIGVIGMSTASGQPGIKGVASGGSGDYAGLFVGNVSIQGNLAVSGTSTINNADMLDGQHGTYYLNASNLNSGTLGNSFFDAYANLDEAGHLGNAENALALNNGTLNTNLNADLLDSLHASSFASATHNHWGETWGGSGTGTGLRLDGGTTGLSGSGNTYGVYGTSNSNDSAGTGAGVHGYDGNQYGIGVSGSGGIKGVSGSANNYGVWGEGTDSSDGTGVYGQGAGYGVYGYSSANDGVYGTGSTGVHGTGVTGVSGSGQGSDSSTGVSGDGFNGVVGRSHTSDGSGIVGYAANGAGTDYAGYFTGNVFVQGNLTVTGFTTNTNFNADLLDGYHAGNSTGNVPINNNTLNTNLDADLLDGLHASGFALASHNHWGETWSGTGIGLTLNGGAAGLEGSGSNIGVSGISWSGNGVSGYGITGVNGTASSRSGSGIYGASYDGAGNHNYAGYFDGNVQINGNQTVTGSKSALVDTKDYGTRTLYTVESPENWFEDFGTGQLVNGVAVIPIEPIYAETVNLTEDYHVFLTPNGDCSLFIDAKTSTSFTVKAIGGQKCSIPFDYRIVAKRLGYEDTRLAVSTDTTPVVAAPGK